MLIICHASLSSAIHPPDSGSGLCLCSTKLQQRLILCSRSLPSSHCCPNSSAGLHSMRGAALRKCCFCAIPVLRMDATMCRPAVGHSLVASPAHCREPLAARCCCVQGVWAVLRSEYGVANSCSYTGNPPYPLHRVAGAGYIPPYKLCSDYGAADCTPRGCADLSPPCSSGADLSGIRVPRGGIEPIPIARSWGSRRVLAPHRSRS